MEVPPLSSKKGAVLEAYVRNSESCLIKEAYPPFGEMDAATRAEWKAIERFARIGDSGERVVSS